MLLRINFNDVADVAAIARSMRRWSLVYVSGPVLLHHLLHLRNAGAPPVQHCRVLLGNSIETRDGVGALSLPLRGAQSHAGNSQPR